MAQAGFTPISLYFSSTAAAVPTSGNLANGELALNIADMKLYAKNSAGVVTLLASNGSTGANVSSLSFGSTGLTPSTATTGAITVAGTLATTNGGTGRTAYTANSVLYASSTSAIASGSVLQFDGTNLLVGTTTSLSGQAGRTDLSVNGSSTAIVSLGVAGARQGYFYTPGTGAIVAAENGPLTLTTTSGQVISFNTNNVERGRFSSGGAFMVGTTTGTDRLTLASGAGVGAAAVFWGNGVGAGSELYVGQGGSNEAYFFNRANTFIAIATNGLERIRVLAGGNTGFGLTDPPYVLSASSNSPQFYLRNPGYGGYIVSTNTDVSLSFTSEGVGERFRIGPLAQVGVGSAANYGTAGQVLTSGGPSAAATWAAAGGGGAGAFVAFSTTGESVFAGQGF